MENEVNASSQKVISAINGLDFEVAARDNIRARLYSIRKSLDKQENLAGRYRNAFINATGNIAGTDEKFGNQSGSILDKIREGLGNVGNGILDFLFRNRLKKIAAAGELFLKDKSILQYIGEYGWDLLKKAGHLGALLGVVENFKKGGLKGILKGGKGAYKLVKDIIKDAKKLKKIARTGVSTKAMWAKKIFGIADAYAKEGLKPSKFKNVFSRWKNNFNKIAATMDEFKDVKKVSKGTWFSLAFDGVINTIDNFQEHGGFSGRMVAETVVETAWDVGVTAVATTAVAATIGAVCGGAPVLAVAGGVILVKKGLDVAANWITGTDKGFTEAVSDGLIDAAEAVGEGIGNFLSKASSSISAGWKKCFGF